ncbi:ubiquitin-specific protease UBP15, partial [Ascoidea rubescens DSM 1968]
NKLVSPVYRCGGYNWDILLFPKGNTNNNNYISLYLQPLPETKKKITNSNESKDSINSYSSNSDDLIDPDWYVCAQFGLLIWNPENPMIKFFNHSHHRFYKDETDWGFSNFIDLKSLSKVQGFNEGFLSQKSNNLNITVFVKVLKDKTGVLWHNFVNYNSKKETGFVGLKNQGATCYLNSLIQSYFFTKSFRKLVYQIPSKDDNSVTLALQRVFYQLQISDDAVDTSDLTRSFGWDTGAAFTQHDVQELNRILMDRLESKMKLTNVEGGLNNIFVGKMKSYIKCINVNYESSRIEDFWDIQLNVKSMKGLIESFKNYIEVELLEGENQYDAFGYGLQDAKKGVVFENFPPVLHLQLKRFEYDFNYDTLMKINDRYEFPDTIDLSPYLNQDNKETLKEDWNYDLYGVLIHQGDISSGHYYTMIRPTKDGDWYRFDDDKVWKVTHKEVFEDNFGCDLLDNSITSTFSRSDFLEYQTKTHTSAYMLVYIRKDLSSEILEEVTDDNVPKHIIETVKREKEEKLRKIKEQEEMRLCLSISLFTPRIFNNYEGFDLAANQYDKYYSHSLYDQKSSPKVIKMLKTTKWDDVYKTIFKSLNYDENVARKFLRLWAIVYRKNYTIRPDCPVKVAVAEIDNTKVSSSTIHEIYSKLATRKNGEFLLYCEDLRRDLRSIVFKNYKTLPFIFEKLDKFFYKVILNENGENVDKNQNQIFNFPTINSLSSEICIFIKYFDKINQKIIGFGDIIMSRSEPISNLKYILNKFIGYPEGTLLDFYEEIKPTNIDEIDIEKSFSENELSNGDIICFTESSVQEKQYESIIPHCENPKMYYRFLATRLQIVFKPIVNFENDDYLDANNDTLSNSKDFHFWCTTTTTYDEMVKALSEKLGVVPEYLRIFLIHGDSRIALRSHNTIGHIVNTKNYRAALTLQFEYEILSITLDELENMKTIKVSWIPSGIMHEHLFEFLVPKDAGVSALFDKLQHKLNFDDSVKETILCWISNDENKLFNYFKSTDKIQIIPDDFIVYASPLKNDARYLNCNPETADEKLKKELEKIHFLPVFQFQKDPSKTHGIPFFFGVYKDETVKEFKTRFQERLSLGQKEFNKIKIGLISQNNMDIRYFDDEDSNFNAYELMQPGDSLFLDHPNRSTHNQNYGGGAIFIKN